MFVEQEFIIRITDASGRQSLYEVNANTEAAAVELALADYDLDFNNVEQIVEIEATRLDFAV